MRKENVLGEKKSKNLLAWGTSIRHSRVGTKFRLKMTLEFLDQINTKIAIEFYILKF